MRRAYVVFAIGLLLLELYFAFYWPMALWSLVLVAPLQLIGWFDFFQTRQAVRRNFPIMGNFRYLFEMIRPEINQYFVESNYDGRPFSREERSVVYQRAKYNYEDKYITVQISFHFSIIMEKACNKTCRYQNCKHGRKKYCYHPNSIKKLQGLSR